MREPPPRVLRPKPSVAANGFSQEAMATDGYPSHSSLPPSVTTEIKLFVLEILGVIGAAGDAPASRGEQFFWAGKARAPDDAHRQGGCAADGGARRTPPRSHALDFDDNDDPGPRALVCSSLLPARRRSRGAGRVNGREPIAALATRRELQAGLGLAVNSMSKGGHPTTVMGRTRRRAVAARCRPLARNSCDASRARLSSGLWHAPSAERWCSGEAARSGLLHGMARHLPFPPRQG